MIYARRCVALAEWHIVSGPAPADIGPGDLVFCYGKGAIAWAIRTVERYRRDWGRVTEELGDKFDHVAIVDAALPDGDWTLIQALSDGVVEDKPGKPSRLSHYDGYVIATCPGDRTLTVSFARAQVGHKYGFITILSFLITLFTPGFINVMLPKTWVCSALAGESLRYGNWLHDWPDIYQVSPAQLWCALASDATP
jgi:hypothetical protein